LRVYVGVRAIHGDFVGLSVPAKVQAEMLAAESVHTADVNVQHDCQKGRDTADCQTMCVEGRASRYLQSKQSKGEQCLVDLAHHDASAIIPMADIAIMRQCSPHPPRQHSETSSPDHKDGRVKNKVETRIETTKQVEGDGSSQNGYRDPGNTHELSM
jgi:hypothetical protein